MIFSSTLLLQSKTGLGFSLDIYARVSIRQPATPPGFVRMTVGDARDLFSTSMTLLSCQRTILQLRPLRAQCLSDHNIIGMSISLFQVFSCCYGETMTK